MTTIESGFDDPAVRMTYAQQQGEEPFDWPKFLEKAESGEASAMEMMNASELSREWVTCACSRICAALPRIETGAPVDLQLAHMGCDFHIQTCEKLWRDAKRTLAHIEARSAYLLSEMEGKCPT